MQFASLSAILLLAAGNAAAQSAAAVPVQPDAKQVWTLQDSGTTASLRGIDSVDGSVAWASGSEGTVLKTIDGGAHWTKCSVPDASTGGATLDFRGIEAWDSATAIVMASGPGEKSRLYKTVDGCASWSLLFKNPDSPDGFFDSFWFNAVYGHGLLLGDPVKGRFAAFVTEDGGVTWTPDPHKGLGLQDKSLAAFAASNTSIARSNHQYIEGFVTGGKSGAVLFSRWTPPHLIGLPQHLKRGEAGGPAWSSRALPLTANSDASGAFSIAYRAFESPHKEILKKGSGSTLEKTWRLVAVGGDYTKPDNSKGTAAFSMDAGKRWTASATPPHGYRSAVQWSSDLDLWVTAGTNGSDISRDDGKTWQSLDTGNWNALSLPFIVGPKGRIGRIDPAALTSFK